ncbi:hypothetical protein X801_09330, partial [Opisthorchis viverrini]
MSGIAPRFISEKDVEARRKTQEEEGVVEEPYDARSLYERLQIEKDRKQEEFEAQVALKNRVHRLDEEEVEYLQTLAVRQHKVELEKEEEIAALLLVSQSDTPMRPSPVRSGPSQRALLANALKRPSGLPEMALPPKPKTARTEHTGTVQPADPQNGDVPLDHVTPYPGNSQTSFGLTAYSDSDSSESSDSESGSTDVEDAACTLMEVAATRLRKSKPSNSEDA